MLVWERYKDPDDPYGFVYWRAGKYRIDPETAYDARSYNPRARRWARRWRVHIATDAQRFFGGQEIGNAGSVGDAKQIAQDHADGKEKA